jgi:hypothetical protein
MQSIKHKGLHINQEYELARIEAINGDVEISGK